MNFRPIISIIFYQKIFMMKHEETMKPENLRFPTFIKTIHHTNMGLTGSKMSFIFGQFQKLLKLDVGVFSSFQKRVVVFEKKWLGF